MVIKTSDICIGILTCNKNKERFNKFMELFKTEFENLGIKYYIITCDINIAESGLEYKVIDDIFM